MKQAEQVINNNVLFSARDKIDKYTMIRLRYMMTCGSILLKQKFEERAFQMFGDALAFAEELVKNDQAN